MKFISYLSIAAVVAGATTASAQDVPANHLLLTEVVINSVAENVTGSSEYAEIYNPTDSPISLDNYYLTDDAQFFNFPIFQSQMPPINNDLGAGDYIMQFPPSYTIPSGGVVVVCWHSKSFADDFFGGNLANFTNLPGSPQLFETGIGANSDPAVPNMISYNANADPDAAVNFSHTNAGEFIQLAYWDGLTDLVQDVDVVSWGSKASAGDDAVPQRGGLASDGPDPDSNLTDYFNDNGIATRNMDVDPGFDPNSLSRRTTIEIGEFGVTGNGHLGQDETVEWCWDTWYGHEGDSNGTGSSDEDNFLTPGLPGPLVKNSDGPTPAIGAVSRTIKDPTPSTPFTITCRAGGVTAPTVKMYLSVNGGAWTAQTMTYNAGSFQYEKSLPGYPDGTYLRYYFEATVGGKTGRYPYNGAGQMFAPYENEFFSLHIRPAPLTDADIILNEINYNPSGSDNATNAEWTEVYNNTASPINLSGGHYSDFATNSERCVIPEGAILPANGFLILTSAKTLFLNLYPYISSDSVLEMHDIRTDAVPGHNNDTDSPMISAPNDYRWGNRPTEILDTFVYDDGTAAPGLWPAKGSNHRTVELKAPNLDNEVAANWALSINAKGSPMAVNQQSAIADWSVY